MRVMVMLPGRRWLMLCAPNHITFSRKLMFLAWSLLKKHVGLNPQCCAGTALEWLGENCQGIWNSLCNSGWGDCAFFWAVIVHFNNCLSCHYVVSMLLFVFGEITQNSVDLKPPGFFWSQAWGIVGCCSSLLPAPEVGNCKAQWLSHNTLVFIHKPPENTSPWSDFFTMFNPNFITTS